MSTVEPSTLQNKSSLLAPSAIAAHLNVPVGSIYYWVSRMEIPFIKVGRHLRFDKEEVLEHFRKLQSEANDCAHREALLKAGHRSVKTKSLRRVSSKNEGV